MNRNKMFLIWSGKHKAWWNAHGHGYTKDRASAGRFTLIDLDELWLDGTRHLNRQGRPTLCDVLVPIDDRH